MMAGRLWKAARLPAITCWVVTFVALVSVAAEFTTQVSSSADDAKAFGSNMEVGSSDALVGNTGYYICDFLARFTNVGVPQGAQVDSAFVVLRTSSSQAGTVCSAAIVAEDTSSSSQFVSYAGYASRHLGDSVVEWYDLPAVSLGDWIRTPDVGTVVGEIVNRGDWLNGNALAIFIRDNGSSSGAIRRFSQFDGNSAYACSLLVYYSVEANSTEIGPRRRRVL